MNTKCTAKSQKNTESLRQHRLQLDLNMEIEQGKHVGENEQLLVGLEAIETARRKALLEFKLAKPPQFLDSLRQVERLRRPHKKPTADETPLVPHKNILFLLFYSAVDLAIVMSTTKYLAPPDFPLWLLAPLFLSRLFYTVYKLEGNNLKFLDFLQDLCPKKWNASPSK